MTKLCDLASLIRSKNAGPFNLTIDVMFNDPKKYERVKDSAAITPSWIAQKYKVPLESVKLFYCDNALAIKASVPRPFVQGDVHDPDNHQGQQFAPFMDVEVR